MASAGLSDIPCATQGKKSPRTVLCQGGITLQHDRTQMTEGLEVWQSAPRHDWEYPRDRHGLRNVHLRLCGAGDPARVRLCLCLLPTSKGPAALHADPLPQKLGVIFSFSCWQLIVTLKKAVIYSPVITYWTKNYASYIQLIFTLPFLCLSLSSVLRMTLT